MESPINWYCSRICCSILIRPCSWPTSRFIVPKQRCVARIWTQPQHFFSFAHPIITPYVKICKFNTRILQVSNGFLCVGEYCASSLCRGGEVQNQSSNTVATRVTASCRTTFWATPTPQKWKACVINLIWNVTRWTRYIYTVYNLFNSYIAKYRGKSMVFTESAAVAWPKSTHQARASYPTTIVIVPAEE